MLQSIGWIKLHRRITGWKWYGDANTVRVFIHLLLSCPPGEGSCRVSVRQMAEMLGISYKETRVAIAHLLSDGTITAAESTPGKSGSTVFFIANWKKFQQGAFNPVENQGLTEEKGRISKKKGAFEGANKGANKGAFNPVENQELTIEEGAFEGANKGANKGAPSLKNNNKEILIKTRADAHTHVRDETPETPASPLTTGFPLPKSITDVQMVATARGILMTDDELQDFYDWHTARGWRDAQGFQFHDWRFLIRGWVARHRREQTKTGDNNGHSNSRTVRRNDGKIGQNFSGDDYGTADDYAPLPSL
jgi:hypothetical protein